MEGVERHCDSEGGGNGGEDARPGPVAAGLVARGQNEDAAERRAPASGVVADHRGVFRDEGDDDQARRLYDKVEADKVVAYVKDAVTLEKKKTTVEKMRAQK